MRTQPSTRLAAADRHARCRLFSRGDEFAPDLLTLTARLQRALRDDELVLHYQPIFEVSSGDLAALEALVRWQDPQRDLVPPAEFIPFAEGRR